MLKADEITSSLIDSELWIFLLLLSRKIIGKSQLSKHPEYCWINFGSKLLNVWSSNTAIKNLFEKVPLTAFTLAFNLLGEWAKSRIKRLFKPL